MRVLWVPTMLAAAIWLGCSDGASVDADPLMARGRQVYLSLCTACHNADPSRDGAAGPAIAGSSRELLEARVLRGEYPPGYEPKRPSQMMPAFPQLADDIDALHAFLSAAAPADAANR